MLTLRKKLTAVLPATLALTMVAGVPASVHAQTNQQRAQESPGAWEWEADEGYHKEEWYDPTDWFDGNQTIDYEYDWDDTYDYDYTDGTGYDTGWVTDSDWFDGYWDGYYDGYHDDHYGYDTQDYLSSTQSDAYTSGYYDGFYDNDRKFAYDPYYYVATWDYDNARRSDQQRAGDRDRERGDRAMPSDRRMANDKGHDWDSKKSRDHQRRKGDAYKSHEDRTQRVRGEVESIEYLRGTGSDSGTDLIARVTFKEDGKKRVVNLGPKMSKDNVPFEQGDRVTFKGVRQQKNDRQVLTTHKLNVNGDTVTLAASPQWDENGNRRAMKRLEGVVRSISSANVDSERFTVLKVQLRDGSTRMVAIPSHMIEDRDEFEAKRGDRIRIEGREQTIGDRSVLRTERIRVNGDRLSMR